MQTLTRLVLGRLGWRGMAGRSRFGSVGRVKAGSGLAGIGWDRYGWVRQAWLVAVRHGVLWLGRRGSSRLVRFRRCGVMHGEEGSGSRGRGGFVLEGLSGARPGAAGVASRGGFVSAVRDVSRRGRQDWVRCVRARGARTGMAGETRVVAARRVLPGLGWFGWHGSAGQCVA